VLCNVHANAYITLFKFKTRAAIHIYYYIFYIMTAACEFRWYKLMTLCVVNIQLTEESTPLFDMEKNVLANTFICMYSSS
jgi:hypothetical protein